VLKKFVKAAGFGIEARKTGIHIRWPPE